MRLSAKDSAFIDANYQTKTDREIGEILGHPSGTICSYRRREGLFVSIEETKKRRAKKLAGRTSSTLEVDALLRAHYLIVNVNQLSIKIGRSEMFIKTRLRQLGLIIPQEIIDQRKKDSRIKKGNTPPNKGKKQSEFMTAEAIEKTKATRFKKGGVPPNTFSGDGVVSIRIDNRGVRQYHIRISLGKSDYLSRYLWRLHRGEIPPKHIIAFKDGNPLHCHIDNLMCITMKENAVRNANHENPTDNRIAFYLATKSRKVDYDLKEKVLQYPSLIEAKRQQLLLKRLIKNERRNNSQTGTAAEQADLV